MKKNVLICIFCIVIFCACTIDKNREEKNFSTGSSIESSTAGSIAAASGSMPSVTETAVKSEKSKKIQTDNISTLRYANDKNIYLGDYGTKIYQYDLCGRRTKCYDLCTEMREKKADYSWTKVLWVDNDDVLFSCYRKKNQYEIWRVPLDRKKGSLRMDQKEKIADNMEEWDCLVIKTGEEIVYSADAKIYKVNLDTNQKEVLKIDTEKYFSLIMRDRQRLPFVQDNKIYYTDIDRVYQMDLGDWKPVYIGEKGGVIHFMETDGVNIYYESEENVRHQEMDENGGYVYYSPQEVLVRFDFQTGKTAQLLTLGRLFEEVDRLGETWGSYSQKVDWKGWDYTNTESVYYHENRLYIAVRVTSEYSWEPWEAWIMFSCQASDGSDFRFEKEVTEYLWKNAIPYKTCYEGDEEESVYDLESVTGEFLYYLDGCIVMHFYDKKAKGDEDAHHRFVVYDINSGTFRKIKKYSKEYGYFKALGFSETSELVR